MLGANYAASEPAGRSPKGHGGGRASASLPLAPKCVTYFVTGPYSEVKAEK